MNEDSTLRGATLSLDVDHYKTTLTKSKVTELIDTLETLLEDDEMLNANKYKIIGEILEEVTEDKFESYADKVEIGGLEAGIERFKKGKRVSKPNEFISVLIKVLERQKF